MILHRVVLTSGVYCTYIHWEKERETGKWVCCGGILKYACEPLLDVSICNLATDTLSSAQTWVCPHLKCLITAWGNTCYTWLYLAIIWCLLIAVLKVPPAPPPHTHTEHTHGLIWWVREALFVNRVLRMRGSQRLGYLSALTPLLSVLSASPSHPWQIPALWNWTELFTLF